MLTERQENILKMIVEQYVKDVKPVGSTSINECLNCSSATVRSEMNTLEELGYLEKTHISSGRIPSSRGYRYYVDHLMKPKELNGEDVLKLQTIVSNKSLMLNDAILQSMEVISDLTNYATVVLGPSSSDNKLAQVEVVPVSDTKFVAIIITDKGHVENKMIDLKEHVSAGEIKKTVEIINKLIVGTPINEVSSKLEFEVKPVIAKYVKEHIVLYNAFYNAFNDVVKNTKKEVSGTSNIINEPEFSEVSEIKKLLTKLEEDVTKDDYETEDGINIYIGEENEFGDNVTVVRTKYKLDDGEGTLAVIGPKRMEYNRVVTLLNYLINNLK